MARKGRPRKAGKRRPNGRLVHEATYDKGSEWVQARVARFGTHYNTALGRAYASGLLGEDRKAQDRYEAGKRFARTYNRIIGGETYRCALDTTPRGATTTIIEDSAYLAKDHEWLSKAMKALDDSGYRPWLDQLLTKAHTDTGPKWLDNLLQRQVDPRDEIMLQAALNALDLLT